MGRDEINRVEERVSNQNIEQLIEENDANKNKLLEGFPFPPVLNSRQDTSNGLVGLDNLGNTCYISSAIQCLSHTKELVEYGLANRWQHELNTINKLGNGGVFAIEFFTLIHSLWKAGNEKYICPTSFKKMVSSKNETVSRVD